METKFIFKFLFFFVFLCAKYNGGNNGMERAGKWRQKRPLVTGR